MAMAAMALCLFAGCNDDDNIGENLFPSQDKPSIYVTDTVEINACTVNEDEVYSSNQSTLILGNMNDPLFGTTTASFCAQFSNDTYGTFSSDAVADSVVLTLGLDTTAQRFYGDSTIAMKLNVYSLKDRIYYDSSYLHTIDLPSMCYSELLGAAEFVPSECDSMISITLNASYGDSIIKYVNADTFEDDVFGLFVQPDQNIPGGCLAKIISSSSYTQYTVYYHTVSSPTTQESISFSIISASDSRISAFKHDYSGTVFGSEMSQENGYQDSVLYLQCGAGTKLKIELPDLSKFNSFEGKYLIVNRAQLICPLADSAFAMQGSFNPIDEIVFMGEYADYSTTYSFSEYVNSSTSVVTPISYDEDNRRYSINMTARVDDLLKTYLAGGTPEYDMMIYPNGRMFDFSRSVICSPTNKTSPMKLIVEYVVFDK